MKKFITIVLAVIVSAYLLHVNLLKAEVVIDDGIYYENKIPLKSSNKTFNVIKGLNSEAEFFDSDFYDAYKSYLYGNVECGGFEYTCEIYNENIVIPLTAKFTIEDGELIEYTVYIDNELFYQMEYINNVFFVNIDKSIDLNVYTNSIATYKFRNLVDYQDYEVYYYQGKSEVFLEDCYYDMGLSLIHGYNYEYNQVYNNQDIYFVTTNSDPLTIQDIEDNISVTDSTDSSPFFEIVDNEYKLNNIDITNGGQYSFTINAYDRSGNITIQKCQVYVYDNIPPVLTGKNLTKDWNLYIDEDDLLDLFTCDDPDATITIEKPDELLYNATNYPNVYEVTATATDLSGNFTTCTVKVIIEDNEKPTITPKKEVTELLSTKKYTKEEILELLTIKDRCYGTNLEVDILNYDYYANFWSVVGRVVLDVSAIDPSGNEEKFEFELYVKDYDFPQIDVGTAHTLFLPAGSQITKEEVIDRLIQLGIIESEAVSVESEYFDSDSPSGSYPLFVTDENGNIYTYKIEITAPDINYDTPIVTEDKKDNKHIIYVVIGIAFILGVAGIMLMIYKKKKH